MLQSDEKRGLCCRHWSSLFHGLDLEVLRVGRGLQLVRQGNHDRSILLDCLVGCHLHNDRPVLHLLSGAKLELKKTLKLVKLTVSGCPIVRIARAAK